MTDFNELKARCREQIAKIGRIIAMVALSGDHDEEIEDELNGELASLVDRRIRLFGIKSRLNEIEGGSLECKHHKQALLAFRNKPDELKMFLERPDRWAEKQLGYLESDLKAQEHRVP
ncbi:hypothetical protein SEMRO_1620_G286490.1 [Seminavis robusta]|uniref:Uncharacterized protein n=1 Tax=Seminavis robusta TaxID=568900 RepID=A0A9N8ET39_9STRA|nr:hypothetical protein SEMRO_1620_G286490.1 [Seminavis robusta]|eukprot:Sro1620_g286490.1 n/a (118) ;mRNA; f:6929-7282